MIIYIITQSKNLSLNYKLTHTDSTPVSLITQHFNLQSIITYDKNCLRYSTLHQIFNVVVSHSEQQPDDSAVPGP